MKPFLTIAALAGFTTLSFMQLAHLDTCCSDPHCKLVLHAASQHSAVSDANHPISPADNLPNTIRTTKRMTEALQVDEHFDTPWPHNISPDGLFRVNGPWKGTGGNLITPQNVAMPASFGKYKGGFLQLKVPGQQSSMPYSAAEIQSIAGSDAAGKPGYGYGYYETRLQVSATPGVCDSFFWIQSPSYGPKEIDFEFLTNEDWIHQPDRGKVHVTIDIVPGKDQHTAVINLPFNPSRSMHRYGFLYTPGKVQFTVDGRVLSTLSDPRMTAPGRGGFIMANEWTGNPNWGGGPPLKTAISTYAWIKFAGGLQKVPSW